MAPNWQDKKRMTADALLWTVCGSGEAGSADRPRPAAGQSASPGGALRGDGVPANSPFQIRVNGAVTATDPPVTPRGLSVRPGRTTPRPVATRTPVCLAHVGRSSPPGDS